MDRQSSTVCNFVLWSMKCELPEDMVDVHVRIRTLWGTHTLKEDREYQALKFKPWGGKAKPFKALQSRLSRYINGRETVAAIPATSVAPKFTKGQEKRQGFRQPSAWPTTRCMRRRQENANDNDNFNSSPKPKEPEQSKPKVWLRLSRGKDPNPKLNQKEKENDCCILCTPEGHECPGHGWDTSDCTEDKDTSVWFKSKDTEEEEEEELPAD